MINQRPSIQSALERLVGKRAWGLRRDIGSIFFLEIGEPVARPRVLRQHGEWHFLIEECPWRLETQNEVLVGSEDEQGFIDGVFQDLVLGSVERAEVVSPSHDLVIEFSSGASFRTFTWSAKATNEWTQWILYGPPDEEYGWVSDGGGSIKCITRDEPVR
jgi:hypothetical protein